MADVARLISALEEYRGLLRDQLVRIRESHGELSKHFIALSMVYEGRGADQFKAGWGQVRDAFDAYVDGVPPMLDLLNDKLDQLRRLDEEL